MTRDLQTVCDITIRCGHCHGLLCRYIPNNDESKVFKFMKQPAVYIMTNQKYGTLYTGVTSDLVKRVYKHRNNIIKGFASRYDCGLLVYFEFFDKMGAAIYREKQIKGGSRARKIALIEHMNPGWNDLYTVISK